MVAIKSATDPAAQKTASPDRPCVADLRPTSGDPLAVQRPTAEQAAGRLCDEHGVWRRPVVTPQGFANAYAIGDLDWCPQFARRSCVGGLA